MSKYCLFLIVIYYLTGGNNSMSRFCKFGKLHVTKGNGDKLLGILLTASKELKRSLAPTGNFVSIRGTKFPLSARDPL
ncbi:rRNA adenine methyltransferase [Campylobacter jejuni]|nr:rRNA adenine methyltransferase [Campylobacter jejuni]